MKGLIPAAGKGTRLGPFTKAVPKELLPVGDKAVMEHAMEMFIEAGITDIVIVVSPGKHGLSDYFGSGKRLGVNLTYVIQDDQLGLADAVVSGEHAVHESSVAVVLGDTFFTDKTALSHLISFHKNNNADVTVGVVEVTNTKRYGIIQPDGINVVNLIEKPDANEAPSNLGMVGIYVFENTIFDAIHEMEDYYKIGYNNEYQLTDAIRDLAESGSKVVFKVIDGDHIDVGTPEDLMKANACYLGW